MAKTSTKKTKSPLRRSGPEGLHSFLATLEKDRLVDLLFNQALEDDRLFRKLDLERSKGKGGGPISPRSGEPLRPLSIPETFTPTKRSMATLKGSTRRWTSWKAC